MSSTFLLVVLVLFVLIIAAVAATKQHAGKLGFPYESAGPLFSPAERSFLGVLDEAVGNQYRIFGKVRVADVAAVKSGLTKSARQGALNRIAAKHFDFVLCRASDLAVVCAIELNDKSHGSSRARVRDALVANVCDAIGMPLVTFSAQRAYVVADVKAAVEQSLAPPQPREAAGVVR